MTNDQLIKGVDLLKPDFSARSSEVFFLEENEVLKLYFDKVDNDNVDIEYQNTCSAFQKGCTPMECFGKVNLNGRNGLIFKRLKGCALTDMPGKNPLIIFKAGKILAGLHNMVHRQCTHELRDVRLLAADTLNTSKALEFLSPEDKQRLTDYIMALPEADNILHLDFHTDNILCDGENYQVIDWMTAARGNPLVEVSMMNFLHHDAELFPGSSKLKIFLMNLVRIYIYNSFIKEYEKLSGLRREDSRRWDIVAYVLRMGIWDIAYEHDDLKRKIEAFLKEI